MVVGFRRWIFLRTPQNYLQVTAQFILPSRHHWFCVSAVEIYNVLLDFLFPLPGSGFSESGSPSSRSTIPPETLLVKELWFVSCVEYLRS